MYVDSYARPEHVPVSAHISRGNVTFTNPMLGTIVTAQIAEVNNPNCFHNNVSFYVNLSVFVFCKTTIIKQVILTWL